MSTYLNPLTITGGTKVFDDLGQLLISLMGELEIDLNNFLDEPEDKLYAATNHLFRGDISCVKEFRLNPSAEANESIGFGRIRWTNLTRLDVRGIQQHRFIPHLHEFPALRTFGFEVLNHIGLLIGNVNSGDARNLPTAPLTQLSEHGLEQIIIHDLALVWSSKYVVAVCEGSEYYNDDEGKRH